MLGNRFVEMNMNTGKINTIFYDVRYPKTVVAVENSKPYSIYTYL